MNCGCYGQEMIDAWNELMDMVEARNDYISAVAIHPILFDDRLRDSWHVPRKIMKNHQVLARKPLFSQIRNQI